MVELLRKLVKVIVTSAVQHSSDFLPAEHFSPRRRRQQYFLPVPSVHQWPTIIATHSQALYVQPNSSYRGIE